MMSDKNKVDSYIKDMSDHFINWENKDLHKDASFIKDGVINPKTYFSQEHRILFILKEAYTKDSSFNLCEWLDYEGEKIRRIWDRVSEWTRMIYGVLDGEIIPFKKDSGFRNNGNEYLRRIAVLNIKKSNGTSISKYEDLKKYAREDSVELFKQLEICDPTIIICGNTGDYLKDIVPEWCDLRQESDVDKEHFIYRMTLNGHNVVVINYWHPANQYPDILNYYGLFNICKVAFGDVKK